MADIFKRLFSGKSTSEASLRPAWQSVQDEAHLKQLFEVDSHSKAVLFFKHSTRCSISATALDRLERAWSPAADERISPYMLLVVEARPLSNALAQYSGVPHQSPQAVLVYRGQVLYHASHWDIDLRQIMQQLS